ncbi:unnamed protein product [Pleuronectes platessa]|uniref:Uncharacterized protein n=1 Tax=Pleuronectes platessa TaxID=8262 RepID=A0A9N7W536_PLEPL|nr:unnamed protein product [Pleuronectes platessa]
MRGGEMQSMSERKPCVVDEGGHKVPVLQEMKAPLPHVLPVTWGLQPVTKGNLASSGGSKHATTASAPITGLLSLPSVCSRAAPLLHSPQAIEYVTSAMGLGAQGHRAP